MKKCSKCNEVKSYEFFSKDKWRKDGYTGQCKNCRAEYNKQWCQENKEQLKEKQKKWCQENKEQRKEYQKQYQKQYEQENKYKRNEYKKEYQKERRKTDVLFKLKHNLRSRTYQAFKNKGYSKNTKTQEVLGVEWKVVKTHIERQFKKGMSWSNYGEWHIDHIIPLASANTEEELINLCRYTNLQPLWAEENISKGCKIEEIQLKIL